MAARSAIELPPCLPIVRKSEPSHKRMRRPFRIEACRAFVALDVALKGVLMTRTAFQPPIGTVATAALAVICAVALTANASASSTNGCEPVPPIVTPEKPSITRNCVRSDNDTEWEPGIVVIDAAFPAFQIVPAPADPAERGSKKGLERSKDEAPPRPSL